MVLYVAWDLETTDLLRPNKLTEIISIGWYSDENVYGEVYAMPTIPIEPGAESVHGLNVTTLTQRGAGTIPEAIAAFLDALKAINDNVVLVAHNGVRFDEILLRQALRVHSLFLPDNVVGFLDTIHLADRIRINGSRTLDRLMEIYKVDIDRSLHTALVDSKCLKIVFDLMNANGDAVHCTRMFANELSI